ncbi:MULTISPECIES: class I SAM-dependent methyltransferase [unclassified Streptomyces]|uniref:class I SAM-dependent methyltransferase n=1 Tax=unclassified Streptomyces TaxID=2593676 RepID=UPI00340579E6
MYWDTYALDFSAAQIARARRWWGEEPNLTFVQAEAVDHLTHTEATYDAVFSIWGRSGSPIPRSSSR